MVLPTSSPRRVELLAVICWTKSQKSPLFPGPGGPWLQMTGALHIVPFLKPIFQTLLFLQSAEDGKNSVIDPVIMFFTQPSFYASVPT